MKTLCGLFVCALIGFGAEKELWQPYYVAERAGGQHVDLSASWRLGWRDAPVERVAELSSVARWIEVARPQSVQMALHHAGELPHPYVNLNSEQYKWVDEKVWYYRKSFRAPAVGDGYAFLYFHGIDYFARVWLNGELLGRHEGMFGGPAIEVSQKLKSGENELVVEVRAGNWGQKATYKPRDPGRIIKPWVIAGGTGGEMFFPVGMWQGVRLEVVGRTHMERPFLVTRSVGGGAAKLHLSVEVLNGTHSLEHQLHPWNDAQMRHYADFWHAKKKSKKVSVEVTLEEKRGGCVALQKVVELEALPGRNWAEADLTVTAPRLWWPNGMGAADLYKVRLALKDGGAVRDSIEFEYGIRSLRMEMTPGPRLTDRWSPWQFVVNDRKLFVKGMNWMPADMLLDLPRERYHWLLSAAKNAGIQLVRIWGGGLIEPEAFYSAANELGIMVWQDFPIGNMITPLFPQAIWEAQVMQTIYRLRNHPSLALYCGGNEFNPYAAGNAASIGILERSVADFDGTRPFRRTSPDNGSMHDYPDMDPAWYARKFPFLPYMSETGMHNIPNAKTFREVVSAAELAKPLERMYDKDFETRFPDFRHHFVEYLPVRVPRMLSRASHVADIGSPSIETIAEATQVGAGEFYQVMSEALSSNYPVTAGLMPWVFKRPWPVVAIQTMDGFGHPTAPYYFLKRTYEPVHVAWLAEQLLWAPGEKVNLGVAVMNARVEKMAGASVELQVLDDSFRVLCNRKAALSVSGGPSVAKASLGEWMIPASYADRFFFVLVELKDASGALVSRQVYWPRSLRMLSDAALLAEFRKAPKEWPSLDKGPWLKNAVAGNGTTLQLALVDVKPGVEGRTVVRARVTNAGKMAAFPVMLEVDGARHSAFASDGYFWLAAGESREVKLEVMWREARGKESLAVAAWNAPWATVSLP